MNDSTPPHGIARPHPLDLTAADATTVACAEARAIIRAQFAMAVARARTWEPGR